MNVLVLATDGFLTLSLLKCLRVVKARVWVMGVGPSPVLRASRGCSRYIACRPDDFAPTAEAAARLDAFCAAHAIHIVLPSGITSVLFLAAVKSQLAACPTFPLSTPDVIARLHDKWRFSQFLDAHSLPQPRTRLLKTPEDAAKLDLTFPVVVKPLDLDGSRGVRTVQTRDELLREAGRLPLLAQEFAPGADVCLSVLAQGGDVRAWTIQKYAADKSGAQFVADKRILKIGQTIMAALWFDGVANFDLRADNRDGSVRVIECNPRFWASLPLSLCGGVNFADLGIRQALGQTLPPAAPPEASYLSPATLLRELLRGRLTPGQVSGASRRGLGLMVSDPLPYLYLKAWRLRRPAGLTAGQETL